MLFLKTCNLTLLFFYARTLNQKLQEKIFSVFTALRFQSLRNYLVHLKSFGNIILDNNISSLGKKKLGRGIKSPKYSS